MLPFSDAVELDAAQKSLATRAMLEVAQVDAGHVAEEIALIRAFYEADAEPGQVPFDSLLAASSQAAPLAADSFPKPEQRDLVVSSCLMVAYADGQFSQAERAVIAAIAGRVGLDAGRLQTLDDIIQDHLLSQLANLPDAASVAVVGAELTQPPADHSTT
jgi:tellurite resistance protein